MKKEKGKVWQLVLEREKSWGMITEPTCKI